MAVGRRILDSSMELSSGQMCEQSGLQWYISAMDGTVPLVDMLGTMPELSVAQCP